MTYYKLNIVPNVKPTIFDSKFGGTPYWTANKEYPATPNGQKLFLLAQINFDKTEVSEPLPSSGMLQFFIGDDDLMGLNFDDQTEQRGFRIVYHEKIDYNITDEQIHQLKLPTQENTSNCLPVYGEFAISIERRLNEEPTPPAHQMLGQAFFTQDDPRYDEKYAELDTLLLQIDTEGEYVMWGDSGVGNFFINRQALLHKNFSRVLYNWDCY